MMEAALMLAPAPLAGRILEAGAQVLKTVRQLFAAKILAANPAQEGAKEAVNARAARILDTHGNAILRYAYSYLHNMEDAEEVLQDTLVQFLRTAPAFESESHEKAWLLRVAGNLSKNRLSYNAVRAADELNDELAAENRDDLSFVWQAVRDLPEKYRAPVHLFYYEGYSTRQIAEILQRGEATVRSDLHRGRALLREILKEAYDFDEIR